MRRPRRMLRHARSLRRPHAMSPNEDTAMLAPMLPHERDESPDPDAGVDRDHIAHAAADVAAGREDTDCYGAARTAFRRARARQGR
jgi:hypothetical protein